MKFTTIKLLNVFIILSILMQSCTIGIDLIEATNLSTNVSTFSFPASDSKAQNLVVNSSSDWKIMLSYSGETKDWIQLSQMDGSGNMTIKVNTKNNSKGVHRVGYIHITAADEEIKITVNQNQNNVFELDKTSLEFEFTGGEQSVVLSNNVKFTVEIPKEADWITSPETKAVTNNVIKFAVSENTTNELRTANIIIKATDSDLMQIITVTQKQNNVFELDKTSLNYEPTGGEQNIVVSSNVKFTVEIPKEADWITIPVTKAVTDNTIKVIASENTTNELRTANIIIKATDSDLMQIITVTQKQNNVFELDKTSLEFEPMGGEQSVVLSNNVKFAVEIPIEADWITIPATKAVENNIIRFVAEENLTNELRTVDIIIRATDSELSQTVKVSQLRYEGSAISAPEAVRLNYSDNSSYSTTIPYTGSHNVIISIGGEEIEYKDGLSLIDSKSPEWLTGAEWQKNEGGKTGGITFTYAFQMNKQTRNAPFEMELRSGNITQKMIVTYADTEVGILKRNLIDYGALIDPETNERGSLNGMFIYGGELQTLQPLPAWLTSVTAETKGERQVIMFSYKPEQTDKADYDIVINNTKGESETYTLVYDNGYISKEILDGSITAEKRNGWAPNGFVIAKRGFTPNGSKDYETTRGIYPYEISSEKYDYITLYKTSNSAALEGVELESNVYKTLFGVGLANTNLMVDADKKSGKKEYPAAKYCNNMGADWYFSSFQEIQWISRNKNYLGDSYTYDAIPAQGLITYWSTTQADSDKVWAFNSQFGTKIKHYKTYNDKVRCVRNLQ